MSKYKVGDKFEIRIAEKYNSCTTPLFRIAGFNSLVFDDNGLDKLKKIVEEKYKPRELEKFRKEAYEQGANDTWEIAKKIIVEMKEGGYSDDEITEIFGFDSSNIEEVFCIHSGIGAIYKVKEYEEKQSQLKVGDIVKIQSNRYRGGECGIVIECLGADSVILHEDYEEKTSYRNIYLKKVNSITFGE